MSQARSAHLGEFELTQRTTPSEIFNYVVDSSETGPDSVTLGSDPNLLAHILLNLTMYTHHPLAQLALELLLVSKTPRRNLLDDLQRLELTSEAEVYRLSSVQVRGSQRCVRANPATVTRLSLTDEARNHKLALGDV